MDTEMSRNPVVRRLAAILAADIAGYSRLMGADEEGTLASPAPMVHAFCIAEGRHLALSCLGDWPWSDTDSSVFFTRFDSFSHADAARRDKHLRNALRATRSHSHAEEAHQWSSAAGHTARFGQSKDCQDMAA